MDNGECCYRRYLEGEDEAFDEIVKALFDKLVFFIERYVHDHHLAEDLAVDTFAEVMVHKTRYDFRVSVKTYIFMIGRSRALTYMKRRKHRQSLSLEEVAPALEDKRAAEELLIRERNQLLHAAIARLPEEMGVAIHLVYFEGLSYDEVAHVMKKNKKQVDNLLYRAKKQLREILEKEEVMTS